MPPFDESLLESAKGAIIADYYRECIQGLPSTVPRFIEEELITDRGYRNSYVVEDALSRGLITREQLDQLINRRLLRRAEQYDVSRVELTHDVLTQAVREERDRRRAEEEKRRLEEQNRKQLRRIVYAAGVAAVFFGFAAFTFFQWRETAEAKRKVIIVQRLAQYSSDIGAKPQRTLLFSVQAASLNNDVQGDKRLDAIAIGVLRQQLRVTGGHPLAGHEKSTRVAAFSRDRHWLVTGSDDGTIRLWDLNNADSTSRSFLLSGHNGPVHGLAFSPDGAWLVSGGEDGTVRFWRLTAEGATPGPTFSRPEYGAIQAMAISPQGDWLVFGTQSGNVCVWKMSAEEPLETPCEVGKEGDPVKRVVFSPKGRWLATTCIGACAGFGATVNLWDLSADFPHQEPKRLLHEGSLREDPLLATAFNSDETRLAVAYGYVAQVWDLTQQNPPQHVVGSGTHEQWIMTIGLSPDNRWLATGSIDTKVKLWDLTGTRKDPTLLDGHSATVRSVVFSDDGRWLATAGDDTSARLWDLSNPAIPNTLLRGQDLSVENVVFSPGAEPRHLVTVGEDPHARLWNIPDSTVDPIVLRPRAGRIVGTAVSPDGKWIASSGEDDPKLLLWSLKYPRKPVRELPLPSPSHAIAFSADGRWLAAKSQDKGVVSLWSLTDLSKKPFEFIKQGWGDVMSLGFSPDSRWLVSGAWEGTVNMWDVSVDSPSSTPRYQCRQGTPVRGSPAFSADGRYVATGAHGFEAHLWDLRAPNPCDSQRPLGRHGDAVSQVAISPNSRWVATASFDGKGRLWDMGYGPAPRLIGELKFNDRVMQAAFSPDNRWIAFGSWDRTIKVLDLKNPAATKPIVLSGHAGRVLSASFSPDSRWLATGGEDRTIRLWDPTDPSAAPVVLRGHEASVSLAPIGFSKDSRWIITSSYDGTVRLWRLMLADLVDVACRTAGRHLTQEEVRDFLGDEHAQGPCTDQPTPGQSVPQ